MYTISELARKSNLPRRTVQYWHDKGVIAPKWRNPIAYDDGSLVLVRLLSPFCKMGLPVDLLFKLSRAFAVHVGGKFGGAAYAVVDVEKPSLRLAGSVEHAAEIAVSDMQVNPLSSRVVVDVNWALRG